MSKELIIELVVLAIIISLGLARGCSKDKQSPELVSIEGKTELLSQRTVEKLEALPLPESMHLKVRIDSLCKTNDYMDQLRAGENMIEIQVYESPLLIKAAMDNRSNVELRGRYGGEYIHTQMLYLNTGDIDYAVEQMARFLCRVNAESNEGLNWFQQTFGRRKIGEWIDDGLYFVASIFKPYDNLWGKVVVMPVYKLALWSVTKTRSVGRGIAMLAVLGGILILLLYIYTLLFYDGAESQILTVFLMKIPKYLYLFALTIIAINLARPNMETIYALNDVYGTGSATPLKLCYTCYDYDSSSPGLIVFAIVLFLFFEFEKLILSASLGTPNEDNIIGATNDFSHELGKKTVEFMTFICCAALLDRMILWVVVIYLTISIIIKLIEFAIVSDAIDKLKAT